MRCSLLVLVDWSGGSCLLENQSSELYGENPTMMSRVKLVFFLAGGCGWSGLPEMRGLTVCLEEEEASACRYLRGFTNDLVPRFSHVEFQCAHPRQVIYQCQQAVPNPIAITTTIRHINFYILWVYQYNVPNQELYRQQKVSGKPVPMSTTVLATVLPPNGSTRFRESFQQMQQVMQQQIRKIRVCCPQNDNNK